MVEIKDWFTLPPAIVDTILKKGEAWLAFWDKAIPLFPSILRVWWQQPWAVQFILNLPILFLLVLEMVILKVKIHYRVLIGLIFIFYLLPGGSVVNSQWDKFVIRYHLDLYLPWSKQYIWLNDPHQPFSSYTKYEYVWWQSRQASQAQIKISCLGHYRISVNGERIYHGPNFAVLPQVYYDALDIGSFIKNGENEIEIICSFIDGITHEYPQYPQPGLLVGGKIKDGFWVHNLADPRLWQYTPMRTLQAKRRLFNAGWVETYDLTKNEQMIGAANQIEPDYQALPRPRPLLRYSPVAIKQISLTVFDLEKFSTGYLRLQTNFENSCQLDLVWGVNLDQNGFPLKYMDQEDTVVFAAGQTGWEQFSRRSGRYVGFRGDCPTDKIKVSFTRVFNGFVQPPKPAGLNQLDEDIFSMSLNSLTNNVQDHFEDSVERERAMYLGDALAVSRCLLVADGNEKLVKQAITQFSQRQNEDGSFPSMAPSGSNQFIVSYSLQWPVWLQLYLQKTGDKQFGQQMWPHLNQWFAWAQSQESEGGLFYNKLGQENWGNFIDWTPIEFKHTYLTAWQIYYLQSLEASVNIAERLGESVDLYQQKANNLKKLILELAYDKKKNIFYDSFDNQNQKGVSLITNSLAGRANLFPTKEANNKAIAYFNSDFFTQTPFSQTWVVDWLLASGKKDLALSVMREYWGGMVKEGATSVFEVYKPGVIKPDKYESHSHAWGCGPVYQYDKIIQP